MRVADEDSGGEPLFKSECWQRAQFMPRSFTHPSIWTKTTGSECANETLHEIQEEGASTKEQST